MYFLYFTGDFEYLPNCQTNCVTSLLAVVGAFYYIMEMKCFHLSLSQYYLEMDLMA